MHLKYLHLWGWLLVTSVSHIALELYPVKVSLWEVLTSTKRGREMKHLAAHFNYFLEGVEKLRTPATRAVEDSSSLVAVRPMGLTRF